MKFQNCILINFEWMHRRMEGRTEGWTSPRQYAPSSFPKLGA